MANYTIKAPDGHTYSITGPEGATDEQVRAQVLAQHPTAAAAAPPPPKIDPTEGMSTYEKTMAGVGGALVDKWQGAKQFANWASGGRIGDKAQLEQEAANKASIDKPLLDTTSGNVGNFVGSVAPELLLGGGAGLVRSGAAKLIPRLAEAAPQIAKAAPKLIPGLAKAAGFGAADAELNPSSDYSPVTNAAIGGVAGLGGDVLGRAAGRVITPLSHVPDLVKEQVARLRAGGFDDSLRAVNTTGNPMIESLSHAFEKTGLSGIGGAREKYGDILTKKLTAEAGSPMASVGGGGAAADVTARTEAQAAAMRKLPDNIPLTNVPAELTTALQNTSVGNALSGQGGATKKLLDARGVANVLREMSPEDFMTARAQLSENAFNASGANKTSIKAAQDALENAFKEKYPHIDFDTWKKQYGLAKDIEKAAPTGGGPIAPQRMVAQLPTSEQVTPTSRINQTIVDAAARERPAPGGENRAFLTHMLLSGTLGGGVGALGSDNRTAGGLEGLGIGAASPYLASRFLLGSKAGGKYMGNTVLSPEARATLRKMLTGGTVGLHDYFSNKE